jgi:dTDP-4-dehydrorhamnose 3,5-epimerase
MGDNRMPSDKLQIDFPQCELGLGKIVTSPGYADLIEGVRIQPVTIWPDDRGFFLEVMRAGQALLTGFPSATTQVSAAYNFAGAIKAFHYHMRQTDCFTPVLGAYQIALADLRRASPTFGLRNTIYAGSLRHWQILIPPGVAHGYKILGAEPGLLVYATDSFYDPDDEGRLAYDHPGINYDWSTQRK